MEGECNAPVSCHDGDIYIFLFYSHPGMERESIAHPIMERRAYFTSTLTHIRMLIAYIDLVSS
jgi:hypothetical protein